MENAAERWKVLKEKKIYRKKQNNETHDFFKNLDAQKGNAS